MTPDLIQHEIRIVLGVGQGLGEVTPGRKRRNSLTQWANFNLSWRKRRNSFTQWANSIENSIEQSRFQFESTVGTFKLADF